MLGPGATEGVEIGCNWEVVSGAWVTFGPEVYLSKSVTLNEDWLRARGGG